MTALVDRMVAHSVFAFEENGVARMSVRGEIVTVTAETIARYDRLGVFEPMPTEKENDVA